MNYDLPTSVTINGAEYSIRWDFRPALDICEALNDPELDEREKIEVMLRVFYPDYKSIPEPDIQEAVNQCMWFINCGDEPQEAQRSPKLVSWEQDFPIIAPAINRVLGYECRDKNRQIHWWTMNGAYMEIGECLFSQVVSIRNKLAKGKKLEKHEREWYSQNRKLVDFKRKYTYADYELLNKWIGGKPEDIKDNASTYPDDIDDLSGSMFTTTGRL